MQAPDTTQCGGETDDITDTVKCRYQTQQSVVVRQTILQIQLTAGTRHNSVVVRDAVDTGDERTDRRRTEC
jgi:hypothetical protein